MRIDHDTLTHLVEWWNAGYAPFDWDRERLMDFAEWVDSDDVDLGWSVLSRVFESSGK